MLLDFDKILDTYEGGGKFYLYLLLAALKKDKGSIEEESEDEWVETSWRLEDVS